MTQQSVVGARCFVVNIPRAEITLPRQTRDRLMFPPSFSRIPSAPVALARSLKQNKHMYIRGPFKCARFV